MSAASDDRPNSPPSPATGEDDPVKGHVEEIWSEQEALDVAR
jgi:hypothetical protein